MRFYTNVAYDMSTNQIHVRGFENGKRISESIWCQPYLFFPAKPGQQTNYRTLDGKPVFKKEYPDRTSMLNFIKKNQGMVQFYGLGVRPFELIHTFINDYYPGRIEYDQSKLSVVYLDIETDSEGGFPNIETADKAITAITIFKNGKYVVLGLNPYKKDNDSVVYIKCKDETELLEKFLIVWQSNQFSPDIVTGWNIEQFDIPYIINRIERVLGEDRSDDLSPFGSITQRQFESTYGTVYIKTVAGITILDYLALYKKFSYTPQESYKLDHIAHYELGEKKLDYRALGYETLDEFYKKDFQNFINYNIKDVELVYKLEDKLKFIEQVCAIAYDAKVNLIEALTTVRMWDIIIHNHLREKNIVVPYSDPYLQEPASKPQELAIQGAYVKDPIVGLHNWVVSFDLNSLYPHLIMQYNISHDTYVERKHDIDIQKLIDGGLNNPSLQSYIKDKNVTLCGSGCMFDRDRQGFLPQLMQKMYDDRVVWKTRMIEAKKKYEQNPTVKLRNEIAQCHNMQLAKKIQLNSAYGALGNKFFRWFDRKYAESITLSGQLAIRWMEKHINEFLNQKLETENVDYVIACDTDSMYINLDKYVEKYYNNKETNELIDILDNDCQSIFEPFIDETYNKLGVLVNAYDQKMKMKREAIADKGIWTGKKHYILNVFDNEGVRYKEPKLKIQGIEAIRSSTPSACRENIKKALQIIMSQGEQATVDFIERFREKFSTLPFDEIAFPRSVQDLRKWESGSGVKPSCPIHVRGSIVYNNMVKSRNLEAKYNLITNGDKIKFCYMLVPNPVKSNVIAAPGYLPPEFDVSDYIDYEKQFEKSFLDPLKTILTAIGWKTEKQYTLEDFFS